jgi:hypothetical protein
MLSGCAGGYDGAVNSTNDALDRALGRPTKAERHAANQAADDARCRELGFQPKTEGYGNCRLQLEQIRATQDAANAQRMAATASSMGTAQPPRLSLLCKDSLARGDQGGAFIHC